jgi:O-antigen/teichoic acid export membrane protein
MKAGQSPLRGFQLGRGVSALLDQGVVSLGTFVTNVLLARSLGQGEYGLYALVLGVMLLLNSVHAALVAYPLSVKGATADEHELRRLAAGSLGLAGGLAAAMGAGLFAAVAALGSVELACWSAAALVLWQAQETVRRALVAHLRYGAALWGDAVSYLGQAALIWALSQEGRLSLGAAFAVMSFTSAAAAGLQAVQLRLRPGGLREGAHLARSFWSLGRWALFTNLVGNFTTQAFPWTLAAFHGVGAAAALQSVVNLMGVSHPVMFGINNLIIPVAARVVADRGVAAARRAAFRQAMIGWVLLSPYYVGLALWPEAALRGFYGAGSPYLALEAPLRLFVVAYVFVYLTCILGALLYGLGDSRATFLGHTAGAAAAVALGLPLTAAGGLLGASVGVIVVGAARAAGLGWFVARPRGPLPVLTAARQWP